VAVAFVAFVAVSTCLCGYVSHTLLKGEQGKKKKEGICCNNTKEFLILRESFDFLHPCKRTEKDICCNK
jgi:hypothetical protein